GRRHQRRCPLHSGTGFECEDTVMGFSAKQVHALRRSLNHRHVRTREANGRELYYIEGWYAMSEANRIFGFDGWNRETIESKCVLAREIRGTFLAIYIARVRITVHVNGATIIREGHGTGEGRGATFGKPFGLAPYGTGKAASTAKTSCHESKPVDQGRQLNFARDDTAPIPRPSRYCGRRQDPVARDLAPRQRNHADPPAPRLTSSDEASMPTPNPSPGKIEKQAVESPEGTGLLEGPINRAGRGGCIRIFDFQPRL